jgi:20S proteasome alpha/beta subunit
MEETPKEKKEEIKKTFPPVKYPEEMEFLKKLNKDREEKYKKWLYEKKVAEKILGRSTLVIGVRGDDGIVLGSDRKVIRGGEIDFEKKVRTLRIKGEIPIIFAASGIMGVIEDFLEIFEKTLTERVAKGEITSLLSIKMIAEDLVKDFEERYAPRLNEYPIGFIFGGLSELKKGEARLYEIGSRGFGAKIKYHTLTGHGSPYARTIANYLFPREIKTGKIPLKCNEVIPRIATCIFWIGGEIDDYVGGEPQIVYILDNNPEIKEGEYDKENVENKVKQIKEELRNIDFEKNEL